MGSSNKPQALQDVVLTGGAKNMQYIPNGLETCQITKA